MALFTAITTLGVVAESFDSLVVSLVILLLFLALVFTFIIAVRQRSVTLNAFVLFVIGGAVAIIGYNLAHDNQFAIKSLLQIIMQTLVQSCSVLLLLSLPSMLYEKRDKRREKKEKQLNKMKKYKQWRIVLRALMKNHPSQPRM